MPLARCSLDQVMDAFFLGLFLGIWVGTTITVIVTAVLYGGRNISEEVRLYLKHRYPEVCRQCCRYWKQGQITRLE